MGSSGSGRFSDYSSTPRRKSSSKKKSGKGGTSGGGASGKDPCKQTISDISLDEVSRCDYYDSHKAVPSKGTRVRIRRELHKRRIAVENTHGELLSLLPTELNYLLACMNDGYSYEGTVSFSSTNPLPGIMVNLRPSSG